MEISSLVQSEVPSGEIYFPLSLPPPSPHLTNCSSSTDTEIDKQLWHETLQLYRRSRVSSYVNRLSVSVGAQEGIFYFYF